MISFDFQYYKPDSLDEAVDVYTNLDQSRIKPIFYGGGSEVISLARANQLEFGAVIDLKGIMECTVLGTEQNQLILGAAVPLTEICENINFRFLTDALKMVADHTTRNRITLGGNLCSTLPYKECILPLLVCNARVLIAGPGGSRVAHIDQIFDQTVKLKKGEFLVQITVDKEYDDLPYQNVKKTRSGGLDYPIVAVSAMKKEGSIRVAFSGIAPYPFRSTQIEDCLNNKALAFDEKIALAMSHIPDEKVNDLLGSSEYREFLLSNILKDILFH